MLPTVMTRLEYAPGVGAGASVWCSSRYTSSTRRVKPCSSARAANAREFLKENPELRVEIENKVRTELGVLPP